MRRLPLALAGLIVFLSVDSRPNDLPASVAALVNERDSSTLATALLAAIDSKDPTVRAAAARVAAVRNVAEVVAKLRDRLASETDADAAREEIWAIVLAGTLNDIDEVIRLSRPLSPGVDGVITRAISRREDAITLLPKLREIHQSADVSFMTQALWQQPLGLAVASGSRFVGAQDDSDWRALLGALRASGLAMTPNVVAASLGSPSEAIRTDSVWYLVHGYANDPSRLPQIIREAVDAPKEEASLRESFGRELLRRMFKEPNGQNPAWTTWLVSPEADELIDSEAALFEYFTDEEFVARKLHCDLASNDCRVPTIKNAKIPSTAVHQPEFELPAPLPPGLADAVVRGSGCRGGGWLGVAAASADRAGRIMRTSIQRISMDDRCAAAVDELMKLSFATPDSIVSPSETKDILLVHARGSALCLDEAPVTETDLGLRQVGGEVKAPIAKRRVEPHFPDSALRRMGLGTDVNVIVQCVISRNGCIRSIRLIAQSPFPELNGAALEAISQWQFIPGQLRGVPIDTVFNLTVHYKT